MLHRSWVKDGYIGFAMRVFLGMTTAHCIVGISVRPRNIAPSITATPAPIRSPTDRFWNPSAHYCCLSFPCFTLFTTATKYSPLKPLPRTFVKEMFSVTIYFHLTCWHSCWSFLKFTRAVTCTSSSSTNSCRSLERRERETLVVSKIWWTCCFLVELVKSGFCFAWSVEAGCVPCCGRRLARFLLLFVRNSLEIAVCPSVLHWSCRP